jgi:hypothetical protein
MEKGGMYSAFYRMQFIEKASKNLISENKEIACYTLQDVTKTTVGDISRSPELFTLFHRHPINTMH